MCLNNVLLKSNRPTNLRENSSYPLDIMLTTITHDNVYTSNVTLRNGDYITCPRVHNVRTATLEREVSRSWTTFAQGFWLDRICGK